MEERKVCLTEIPVTGKIIKTGNEPNLWVTVTIAELLFDRSHKSGLSTSHREQIAHVAKCLV